MQDQLAKEGTAKPLFDAVKANWGYDIDDPLKHFDSRDAKPKPYLWYAEYMAEYTVLIEAEKERQKLGEELADEQRLLADLIDGENSIGDFEQIIRHVTEIHTPGRPLPPLQLKTVNGQLLALAVNKMMCGRATSRFDPALVRRFQTIFCQSPAAYMATRELFDFLPCKRTMMAHRATTLVTAGIDQASIKRAVELAQLMGYFNRPTGAVGYIVTDDVEAARGVDDRADGVAEGFRTDTDFSELFTEEELKQAGTVGDSTMYDPMLATGIAQFYWVSDDGRLQFALGHFYVAKGDDLRAVRQYKWLTEVITALYANGFRVWAVVSDQHSMNVAVRKMFTKSASSWSVTGTAVQGRKRVMTCTHTHAPPNVPIIHQAEAGVIPLPGLSDSVVAEAASVAGADSVKDSGGKVMEWTEEMEQYSCPHPIESYPMRLFFLPDNEHMLKAFRNALASTDRKSVV